MLRDRLSPRERDIAKCLLEGMDNAEMAKYLGISYRTVKMNLNRMFMKFGITDGIKRVKLAVMLYREERSLETPVKEISKETLHGD